MKKLNLFLMLAMSVFLAFACSDNDDDDNNVIETLTDADKAFINSAADGGMFEVRAGELASTKGDSMMVDSMMTDSMMTDSMMTDSMNMDSMNVRSFGRMMVTDHTKANNELKSLADSKGVTVPTTLSNAKQQKVDSLNTQSGQTFNRTYINMMVASHQETIDLFQKQADSGNDADLKSWAASKLPTLRMHLEHARSMQSKNQNQNQTQTQRRVKSRTK